MVPAADGEFPTRRSLRQGWGTDSFRNVKEPSDRRRLRAAGERHGSGELRESVVHGAMFAR